MSDVLLRTTSSEPWRTRPRNVRQQAKAKKALEARLQRAESQSAGRCEPEERAAGERRARDEAPTVLLIDHDLDFCRSIVRFLIDHGLEARQAMSSEQARKMLVGADVDLVILGRVGTTSGMDLVRAVSVGSDRPIIIIAEEAGPVERIVALELGADDLLPRTGEPRELLARVRALLRRSRGAVASPREWELNSRRRVIVSPGGKVIQLTDAEFTLMCAFDESGSGVVTPADAASTFLTSVGNPGAWLRTAVARLRRKLDDSSGEIIRTISGRGYVLDIVLVMT